MSNEENEVKKEWQKEWHVLANHSLSVLWQRLLLSDKIDGYAFSMFTKCDDGDVLYSSSVCASRDEEFTLICKQAAELYLKKHPRDSDFPHDMIALDKSFIMELVERIEKEVNDGFDDRKE
jgi:hypothetical protein